MLLPLACAWAAEQERVILQSGVPLTDLQLADARRVGVAQPDRIRLLRVVQIPSPTQPALAAAASAMDSFHPRPQGLRFGMAFSFGLIVGDSAVSSCMSLSTRCSMSGLAGLRAFCGLTYWNASIRLVIPLVQWSRKPREFRDVCLTIGASQKTLDPMMKRGFPCSARSD